MELANPFKNVLAEMQAKAEAKQARSKTLEAEQEPKFAPAKIVQLPLWPNEARGVPNAVLRSALFGAIRRGKRAYQDAVIKASVDGVTVVHTGPQLDQADLDVWEECLQLAKTDGLGVEIHFSGHGFLKAIGRSTGKSQHDWLKSALRRLMTSLVEVQDGKRAYAGQLIHDWYRDDETGHHVIKLNPQVAKLYGSDGWTAIEKQERQALKGLPLAQWLHGFYSTHASPYPYKVETLHKLCGSETGEMRNFKQTLKNALEAVCEATGWDFEIDDQNLVHLKKLAIGTQKRHLARKAKKARHSKH
ncbi:plasmid replication initiator TrfA (plasmid) [Thiomicrospira sp. R3]|uniref:plasmid replication initiator TrfA n=1 Tax=Thiomicrospira sp. R3 TaxID=3035472 RepID=UPI00259BADBE|nr:plasmid replication initiator TrfA [Thiomicrospira sp. R3]WFE69826.1 plasmid replication initiator TrfA [Thiomicrospira sp. R3]WFE69838.1 plasmid replication initiator TrfA [Thiomicrospira sp. R3]